MKIGMYMIGNPQGHSAMGALATRVAKHVMPGIEVWHFTDKTTPGIEGCNVSRKDRDVPMAVFRMQHHQVPGEWLFIDVDVLVTREVSNVFSDPFDIALAERVDGDGAKGKPGWDEMPYNMGVVFSRSPEFWATVEKELKTYSPKQQEWMGDQLAVCRLLKDFNTKILPCWYNFPPFFEEQIAPITHYKGRRKTWMPLAAYSILEGK